MTNEQLDLIEYLLSAFIVDQRRRPDADKEAVKRHVDLARSTISALNELREDDPYASYDSFNDYRKANP